jgi:hypothetical protein
MDERKCLRKSFNDSELLKQAQADVLQESKAQSITLTSSQNLATDLKTLKHGVLCLDSDGLVAWIQFQTLLKKALKSKNHQCVVISSPLAGFKVLDLTPHLCYIYRRDTFERLINIFVAANLRFHHLVIFLNLVKEDLSQALPLIESWLPKQETVSFVVCEEK